MKSLIIGGSGIETKIFSNTNKTIGNNEAIIYDSIGGSGLLSAVVSSALGNQTTLVTNHGKTTELIAKQLDFSDLNLITSINQKDPTRFVSILKSSIPNQFYVANEYSIEKQQIDILSSYSFDTINICYVKPNEMNILKSYLNNFTGLKYLNLSSAFEKYSISEIFEIIESFDCIQFNESEWVKVFNQSDRDIDSSLFSLSEKKILIKTKGSEGVDIYNKGNLTSFPIEERFSIIDTTGAGDAFAISLASLLRHGNSLMNSVHKAQLIAQKYSMLKLKGKLQHNSWKSYIS